MTMARDWSCLDGSVADGLQSATQTKGYIGTTGITQRRSAMMPLHQTTRSGTIVFFCTSAVLLRFTSYTFVSRAFVRLQGNGDIKGSK